jgi:hypothetical protein
MHGKAVFDEVIMPIVGIFFGIYFIYISIKHPEKLGKYQKSQFI